MSCSPRDQWRVSFFSLLYSSEISEMQAGRRIIMSLYRDSISLQAVKKILITSHLHRISDLASCLCVWDGESVCVFLPGRKLLTLLLYRMVLNKFLCHFQISVSWIHTFTLVLFVLLSRPICLCIFPRTKCCLLKALPETSLRFFLEQFYKLTTHPVCLQVRFAA